MKLKNKSRRYFALLSAVSLIGAGSLLIAPTLGSAETINQGSTTPGAYGTIVIPSGVTSVHFEMQAGNGQAGQGPCAGTGGAGAIITGTLSVEPDDELTYYVGKDGSNGGEYGGGDGGNVGGGAGGDASYLYLNGEDNSDIVAVAGAGGGGAGGAGYEGDCNSYYGGNGGDAGVSNLPGASGSVGEDLYETTIGAGAGGTTATPGVGGIFIPPVSAGNDANGLDGGAGGDSEGSDTAGGGGGGAGFYGGGGGAGGIISGSGGGAGSGYYNSELVTSAIHQTAESGSVHVTISYEYSEPSTTLPEETTLPSSTTITTPTTTAQSPTIGPNNGDGNGDGIKDAEQSNVHTILSNKNGLQGETWITFEHPKSCDTLTSSVSTVEQFSSQDTKFNYPANFFGFEIKCPASTVTVDLYFHNVPGGAKNYTPRKYLSYKNQYITLEGASVKDVTIGGKNVVKLTYSLTDGGVYDNDQSVNGVIVDPASIAYTSSSLPTTGVNASTQIIFGTILLITGGALLVVSIRKRKLI